MSTGVPDGWIEVRLEDLADSSRNAMVGGPFGSNLLASDYTIGGVPVIRGENLTWGRWVAGDFAFVSPEKAAALSSNRAAPWDIVFTQRGANHYRQVAVVPPHCAVRPVISQSQMKITVDSSRADPLFVYYLFRAPEQQDHLQRHEIQGGVPHTNLTILRKVPLRVPGVPEQRGIARVLGTLDDKIESNARVNKTLEEMASALFRYWFDSLDYALVQAENLIRDRVLKIGDGYRAKNSELGSDGLPFVRAGNLDDGIDTVGAERLCQASVLKAGDKVSQSGDVAFTSKGTVGRFARVTPGTPRFVYSPQVCFWRSLDAERLDPVILYCWMRTDDFMAQVEAVSGQTDMAPYVSLRDQRRISVPAFPDAQHAVARQIEPLLTLSAHNTAESRTLAALRDTLLPKLLSGEIRLRDAERAVAGSTA